LAESDIFAELDAAHTDREKIFKAIAIMAEGETELSPVIKARLDRMEASSK